MCFDLLDRIMLLEEADYTFTVKSALSELRKFCLKSTNTSNSWIVGDKTYFIEWPDVGGNVKIITGNVYEKIGITSRFVGVYAINFEGKIVKFPFLPKRVKEKINNAIK